MGNLCQNNIEKDYYQQIKQQNNQLMNQSVYGCQDNIIINLKNSIASRSNIQEWNGATQDMQMQSLSMTPYENTIEQSGAAQTDLTDIQIDSVNDLAFEKWSFEKWSFLANKTSQVFVKFNLMDNLVIQACQTHLDEMQPDVNSHDYLVPLSNGVIVNLNQQIYFVHDKPKQFLKITNQRIHSTNPNIKQSKSLDKSVGSLAEKLLQDSMTGKKIFRETQSVKDYSWKDIQSAWVGTQWFANQQLENGAQGNPSLNTIKEGIQQISMEELMATAKMKDNKYAEQAKELRIQVWEIIFGKIQTKDMFQPIEEDQLWAKRDCCPIVQALLQIYYLMFDQIIEASNKKDQGAIETLGPLAYVMMPIAYGIHNRKVFTGVQSFK